MAGALAEKLAPMRPAVAKATAVRKEAEAARNVRYPQVTLTVQYIAGKPVIFMSEATRLMKEAKIPAAEIEAVDREFSQIEELRDQLVWAAKTFVIVGARPA